MTAYVFSFVFPFLFLAALFRRMFERGRRYAFDVPPALAGTVLCGFLVLVPVAGIPAGRWLTSLNANFSIPLAALLFGVVWRSATGRELFSAKDMEGFRAFGVLAGLFLYPMALGLGSFDPYTPGWAPSWLFMSLGAVSGAFLFQRSRFGVVLLLAAAAWHLRLLESTNAWDYVVDPVYFAVSLVGTARALRRGAGLKPAPPTQAAPRT